MLQNVLLIIVGCEDDNKQELYRNMSRMRNPDAYEGIRLTYNTAHQAKARKILLQVYELKDGFIAARIVNWWICISFTDRQFL